MNKYIIILIIYLLTSSCAALKMERAGVSGPDEIEGTFNVIMVGGTFLADAERLVILDSVSEASTFRPVTIPGRIKIIEGVSASEALQKAEMFFSDHCAYDGYGIKKLSRPDGGFVGYELTPDYPPLLCEYGNVLQVGYGQGDEGEITVYTWLLLKRGSKSSDK